ncbi:MAG: hypothetical protein WCI94_01200 [Rhodospirillales bacterium]
MSGFKVAPLNFGPDPLFAYHTWVGLAKVGAPIQISLRADVFETRLRPILSNLGQDTDDGTTNWLEACLAKVNASLPDDIGQQIADMFGEEITTGRANIATGKPATIGKIGIGGKVDYDGPDDIVPGMALPVSQALDFVGITKKFRFLSTKPVSISLIFDDDAALNRKFDLMVSGCSIKTPVKVKGWNNAEMTVKAGRDQFGGLGFSFGLKADF